MNLFDNKQNLNLSIFPKYTFYSKLDVLEQLNYSIHFKTYHENLFVNFIAFIKLRKKLNINFHLTSLFETLQTILNDFKEYDYLINFLRLFLLDKNIVLKQQFDNLINNIQNQNHFYSIFQIFKIEISKLELQVNRLLSYKELYPNEANYTSDFQILSTEQLNDLNFDYTNLNLNLNSLNLNNIEYLYPYLVRNQDLFTEFNNNYNITENLFYSLVSFRQIDSIFDKLLQFINKTPDFEKLFNTYSPIVNVIEKYNFIIQTENIKYGHSLLATVTNLDSPINLEKVQEMFGLHTINIFQKYFYNDFLIQFFFKIQEYSLFTSKINYNNVNQITFQLFQKNVIFSSKENFYVKIEEFLKINSKSFLNVMFNSNKSLTQTFAILFEDLYHNIYNSLNSFFKTILFQYVGEPHFKIKPELVQKLQTLTPVKIPKKMLQLITIFDSSLQFTEDFTNQYTYIYKIDTLVGVDLNQLYISLDYFEKIFTSYDNIYFTNKFKNIEFVVQDSIFFTSFQNISNRIKNETSFNLNSEEDIANLYFKLIIYKFLVYTFILIEKQLSTLNLLQSDILKLNLLENSTDLQNLYNLNELSLLNNIENVNTTEFEILDSLFDFYDFFKLNQFIYYTQINSKLITTIAIITKSQLNSFDLKKYLQTFLYLICNDIILEKCNTKFILDNLTIITTYLKETNKIEDLDIFISQTYNQILNKKKNFYKLNQNSIINLYNDTYIKIENMKNIINDINLELVDSYNKISIPEITTDISYDEFNQIKNNNISVFKDLIFNNFNTIDNSIFNSYNNFITDLEVQNNKIASTNKELKIISDLFTNNPTQNKYKIKILEIESRLNNTILAKEELEKKLKFTLDESFSNFKFISKYFLEIINYAEQNNLKPQFLNSIKQIKDFFDKSLPNNLTNRFNFEFFKTFSHNFQQTINVQTNLLQKIFLDNYVDQIKAIPQISFNNITKNNSQNIYHNLLNFLFIEKLYNSIEDKTLFQNQDDLIAYVDSYIKKNLNSLEISEELKLNIINALVKENLIDEISGFKKYLIEITSFKFNDLNLKIEFLGNSLLFLIKALIKNSFFNKTDQQFSENDFYVLKSKVDSIILSLTELNNNSVIYSTLVRDQKYPKDYITNVNSFINDDISVNSQLTQIINTYLTLDNNPNKFNTELNQLKVNRENLEKLNQFIKKIVTDSNYKKLYNEKIDPKVNKEITTEIQLIKTKLNQSNEKIMRYFNENINYLPLTIQDNLINLNSQIQKINQDDISNNGILTTEILFDFMLDLNIKLIFNNTNKILVAVENPAQITDLQQIIDTERAAFENRLNVSTTFYYKEVDNIKNRFNKYKETIKNTLQNNDIISADISSFNQEISKYRNKIQTFIDKAQNKQKQLQLLVDGEIDNTAKNDIINILKIFKTETQDKITTFLNDLDIFEQQLQILQPDNAVFDYDIAEIDIQNDVNEIKLFISKIQDYKNYSTQIIVFENQMNQIELTLTFIETQLNTLFKNYSADYLDQLKKYQINIKEYKTKIESDYTIAFNKVNEIVSANFIPPEDYLDYIKRIKKQIDKFNKNESLIYSDFNYTDQNLPEYGNKNLEIMSEQFEILKDINFLNNKIMLFESQENSKKNVNEFKQEFNNKRISQLEDLFENFKLNLIKTQTQRKRLESVNANFKLQLDEFKIINNRNQDKINQKNQIILSLINYIAQKIQKLNTLSIENLNFDFKNNPIYPIDFDNEIDSLYNNFSRTENLPQLNIEFENRETKLNEEIDLFLSKTFELKNITINDFKVFLQKLSDFLIQNQTATLIPKLCQILNMINNKIFNLEKITDLTTGNIQIIDNTIRTNEETINDLNIYIDSLQNQTRNLMQQLNKKNLEVEALKNIPEINQRITPEIQNFISDYLNSHSKEIQSLDNTINNNVINNLCFSLSSEITNKKKSIINNMKSITSTNSLNIDFINELFALLKNNNNVDNPLYLKILENVSEFTSLITCPITLSIMSDPYIAADGFRYEKAAIEEYIRQTNPLVSIMTREPMLPTIVKDFALKKLIDKLKQIQILELTPKISDLENRFGPKILETADPDFSDRFENFFKFKTSNLLNLTETLEKSKISFSRNELELLKLAEYNFTDETYNKYKTTTLNLIGSDRFTVENQKLKADSIQLSGLITDLSIFIDENNDLMLKFSNEAKSIIPQINFTSEKYNINKNGFQIKNYLKFINYKAILNVSNLLTSFDNAKTDTLFFLTPTKIDSMPTLINFMFVNNLNPKLLKYFFEFDFSFSITNLSNIDLNSLYIDNQSNKDFLEQVLKLKNYNILFFISNINNIMKVFSFYQNYYTINKNFVDTKIQEYFNEEESRFINLDIILDNIQYIKNFKELVLNEFYPQEENSNKTSIEEITKDISFILNLHHNQIIKLKNIFLNINNIDEFIVIIKTFNFLSQIITRNKPIELDNEELLKLIQQQQQQLLKYEETHSKLNISENSKIETIIQSKQSNQIKESFQNIQNKLNTDSIHLLNSFSNIFNVSINEFEDVVGLDIEQVINSITTFDIQKAKNSSINLSIETNKIDNIELLIQNIQKLAINIQKDKKQFNKNINDNKIKLDENIQKLTEKIADLESNNEIIKKKLEEKDIKAKETIALLDTLITDENKIKSFFAAEPTLEKFKQQFLTQNNDEDFVQLSYDELANKYNKEYFKDNKLSISIANQIDIINKKINDKIILDFKPIVDKIDNTKKKIIFNTYPDNIPINIIFKYTIQNKNQVISVDIFAKNFQMQSIPYYIYKLLIQELLANNKYQYSYGILDPNLDLNFLPKDYYELLNQIDMTSDMYPKIVSNTYSTIENNTVSIFYFIPPTSNINNFNTSINPFINTLSTITKNPNAIENTYTDKIENITNNLLTEADISRPIKTQNFINNKILLNYDTPPIPVNTFNFNLTKNPIQDKPPNIIQNFRYNNTFHIMQNKIIELLANNSINSLIPNELENKNLYSDLKRLYNYLQTYDYNNLNQLREQDVINQIKLINTELTSIETRYTLNNNIQNLFSNIREFLKINEIFNIPLQNPEEIKDKYIPKYILKENKQPIIFQSIKTISFEIQNQNKPLNQENLNNQVYLNAVKNDIKENDNLIDYEEIIVDRPEIINKSKYTFILDEPIIKTLNNYYENDFKRQIQNQDDQPIPQEQPIEQPKLDDNDDDDGSFIFKINVEPRKKFIRRNEPKDIIIKFSKKSFNKNLNIYPLLKQMKDQTDKNQWLNTLASLDSVTNFNLFDIDSQTILELRALKNINIIPSLDLYSKYDCVDVKYNNIPYANLALIGPYNPELKPIYFVFPLLPVYYINKFKIKRTVIFQELLKKYQNLDTLIQKSKSKATEILNLENLDIVSTFSIKDFKRFTQDFNKLQSSQQIPLNNSLTTLLEEISEQIQLLEQQQDDQEPNIENIIQAFENRLQITQNPSELVKLKFIKKQIEFINKNIIDRLKPEFVLKKKTALIPKRFNFKFLEFKYNIYIFYFNQIDDYYQKKKKLENDFYFKTYYIENLIPKINQQLFLRNNLIFDKLFEQRNQPALNQLNITNSYSNSDLYI